MALEPLTGGDPGQIAGYLVQARLGVSAAGPVYLAAAPDGRPVAITVLRPEFAADQAVRGRLAEELGAARAIQSPHLVPLLDADFAGPQPWFATGYLPGPSLREAIAQYGPMPTGTALLLTSAVAQALAAVHAAGLVHRDLRPSAVLLAQSGPQVTGLGVAATLESAALGRAALRGESVRYQAPEQLLGEPPAAASADVFALGHLTAYALLGRSPFGTGDPVAVGHRILHEAPDLAGCPEFVCELIERMLAKDPQARPAAAEVVEFCAAHLSPQAPPPLWPAPIPAPAASSNPARPPVAAGFLSGAGDGRRGHWPLSRPATLGAAAGVVLGAVVAAASVLLLQSPKTVAAAATSSPSPSPVAHVSPSASPSPSPTATPALDPCLVGSWKGAGWVVAVTMDGTVQHFNGTGPSATWKADGTSTIDFGNGSVFTATIDGNHWVEVLKGTATEHDETRAGVLLGSNTVAKGSWTLSENGSQNNSGTLSMDSSPEQYTCNETTLREYDSNGNSQVFTRVSH